MEIGAFEAGPETGMVSWAGAELTGAVSAAGAFWIIKKTAAVGTNNTGMRRDMMTVNLAEKRKDARTR